MKKWLPWLLIGGAAYVVFSSKPKTVQLAIPTSSVVPEGLIPPPRGGGSQSPVESTLKDARPDYTHGYSW